jgi:nicotinamide-nucleotide amidase
VLILSNGGTEMNIAEILSVGEELLLGDVVDTNAALLSRFLREAGYTVLHRQTCGDDPDRLEKAMTLALSRADVVLVTGGLGPTYDDITREIAARVFGVPLLPDQEVERDIREYFSRRGVTMSENNLLQAQVPEGALVLKNDWGTAPGLWLSGTMGEMILLPGVPREMKNLMSHRVLPELKQRSDKKVSTRILHFYGISESLLDEKIRDLTSDPAGPIIAPYAGNGEVELHVTATGKEEREILTQLEDAEGKILTRIGEFFYGRGETSLEETLVLLCKEKGVTLATAESCTGGLLSQRITSVPGSSAVMTLGVTSYTEEVKKQVLKVREATLAKDGVYSKACALEMAQGVRRLSGADIGVGITGIAGPGGETESDPVGTVYLAVTDGTLEFCERCSFGQKTADRKFIRTLAASKALSMVLFLLKNGKQE